MYSSTIKKNRIETTCRDMITFRASLEMPELFSFSAPYTMEKMLRVQVAPIKMSAFHFAIVNAVLLSVKKGVETAYIAAMMKL